MASQPTSTQRGSAQRTNIPKQAPLAVFQPHKAQTYVFRALCAGTDVPVQFPFFALPPGSVIRALPQGTVANGQVVVVSDMYEKAITFGAGGLLASGCVLVQPGVDVQLELAVDNLNELWMTGPAGSGQGLTLVVTIPALS